MNTYLRLLQQIKPYWERIVLSLICMILSSAGTLSVLFIIQQVVDKVLIKQDFQQLNLVALLTIVIFFVRSVAIYGQNYLTSYVGQRVIANLRDIMFRHMQKFSLAYYERRRTGAMMSRMINDVGVLQSAITAGVIDVVTESLNLIGAIGIMVYMDWKLSLLTLLTMPPAAYTIQIFGKKIRRASRHVQEKASDISSVLQETISAVRVVKSFVREAYEIKRFSAENQRNFRAIMKGVQLNSFVTPIVEFLGAVGVTIILWYGGKEVVDGVLTSGALITFLLAAAKLSDPIKRLSRVVNTIQQALAAADRIFEVIDTKPEVTDLPGAVELPQVQGYVQFHEVTFGYEPQTPVVHALNFTALPGEVIALVGPSGAGKTTVINLIPRFYDPSAGYISIDGHDIKNVTLTSLREQIGIVPQETVLFSGTIYDNIRYGKLEATNEEIIAAAQAANAHNFIMAMPAGYDTQIGERGVKISGGQKQRVAIARAILKNPKILLLDEATSALDTESEKLVQEALERLMINRTTFVVAHRLSTIKNANRIIVMDKGRIIETGTHDELLQQDGLYSKLYRVQFQLDDHQ